MKSEHTVFRRTTAALLIWILNATTLATILAATLATILAATLDATELAWSGPATVRADAAALLFSGQNGGDLALAVLPVPLPSSLEASTSVAVFVEVEGRSLLAEMAETSLEVEIFAYVIGERNQVLAHRNGRLEIDLEQHRQALEDAGLALALRLEVPPGEHRLRLLVRRSAKVFGLRSMPLSIPAPEAPLLLPALVPRPEERWLTANLGLPKPTWATTAWPPASRPVWTLGTPAELLAVGIPQDTTVAARLTPAAAGSGPPLELPLTTTAEATEDGLRSLRGTLDTTRLTPGIYHLTLFTTARSATRSATDVLLDRGAATPLESPPVEVFIAASAPPCSWPSILWTDLLTKPTNRAPSIHLRAPPDDLPRPRRANLRKLYIEALESLAAGAQKSALEQLQTLEERALHSPRAPGVERLAAAQDAVLGEIVKIFPEALLPILLLHFESAAQYVRSSRFQLANHAEDRVLTWAEVWASTKENETFRDAAPLLAALAAARRGRGDLDRASDLFRQALNHDGDNSGALLGLATIRDRMGAYNEAADLFARLLERQPLHNEARLRRALSLVRAGEAHQGKALLERLTYCQETWIAVLAFQELARLASTAKDLTTADRILTRGMERFSIHPGLRLQRAALLDRLGRAREAARLLAPVDAPQPAEPVNERMRYNRWPEEAIEAGRVKVQRRAAERLGELQRALESVAGDRR